MDLLLVPDFVAMSILLGVLAVVRRRYPQHDIRLWMGGLLLILLESAARVVYGMHLPLGWHRASHVVALDAYMVAGVLFLRSSLEHLRRMPRAALYVVLNTAPSIALMTVYGCNLRDPNLMLGIAVAGALTAVLTNVTLHRSRLHLLALLAVWLPVMGAALMHLPRWMVYMHLALVYMLAAITFAWALPRNSSGKITVVTGFAIWSLCFLSHPWIAESHPHFNALASEVWNLQKFLITVGFLLVLFEKQVDNNEWLALHDQLTGLPNRRLLEDRISHALARAERNRTAILLFTMDLDNFKTVNDTLGHDAGDVLLRTVGANLQSVVRRTDTLARHGGDEFTLLAADVKTGTDRTSPDQPGTSDLETLHHTMLLHAARIEADIRRAVNRPVLLPSADGVTSVEVRVSIGVAAYPSDSTDFAELTRLADRRMYEDKRRQQEHRGGLDRVLSLIGAS